MYRHSQREGLFPEPSLSKVPTLTSSLRMDGKGCAGHPPDRPPVMIAATAIDKTGMADEVCHVLLGSSFLPVHFDGSASLMCSAAVSTGDPAYLCTIQLKRMFASKAFRNAGADALGFAGSFNRQRYSSPYPQSRSFSDSACC